MAPRLRTTITLQRGWRPSPPEQREGELGGRASCRSEWLQDSERESPTRARHRSSLERESADRLNGPANSEQESPLPAPATGGVRTPHQAPPTEGKATRLHCSPTPNVRRASRARESCADRRSRRLFRTFGHPTGRRRPSHPEHFAIPPPSTVSWLRTLGVGAAMIAAEPRTPFGQPRRPSRKRRTPSAPLDASKPRVRTSAARFRTVVVQLRSYHNTNGDNNS